MKLMTKKIAAALNAADQIVIASNGEKCPDKVIVKYFNPCGASTWLITSATPVDANGEPTSVDGAVDWHMFGTCDLYGDGGELGYVMLSDLQSIQGPLGIGIERDLSVGVS